MANFISLYIIGTTIGVIGCRYVYKYLKTYKKRSSDFNKQLNDIDYSDYIGNNNEEDFIYLTSPVQTSLNKQYNTFDKNSKEDDWGLYVDFA